MPETYTFKHRLYLVINPRSIKSRRGPFNRGHNLREISLFSEVLCILTLSVSVDIVNSNHDTMYVVSSPGYSLQLPFFYGNTILTVFCLYIYVYKFPYRVFYHLDFYFLQHVSWMYLNRYFNFLLNRRKMTCEGFRSKKYIQQNSHLR